MTEKTFPLKIILYLSFLMLFGKKMLGKLWGLDKREKDISRGIIVLCILISTMSENCNTRTWVILKLIFYWWTLITTTLEIGLWGESYLSVTLPRKQKVFVLNFNTRFCLLIQNEIKFKWPYNLKYDFNNDQ